MAAHGQWAADESGISRFIPGKDAWGYRDEAGELAVPCRYAQARPFCQGLAVVAVAGTEDVLSYGLISTDGGEVTPADYEDAVVWEDGTAALSRGGGGPM